MRISQFQKYSQKENTVTNNVLLMLSRLNDLNINYYKEIVERLNEGNQNQMYYPQPIFSQQIGGKNGIIDGHIEVKPSKILIETKLGQKEIYNKLIKYGTFFNEGSQNQLWHLSSKKFQNKEVVEINKKIYEKYPSLNIQFNNLSFKDLVENLEGIYEENIHDMELKLLLQDFRAYCEECDLLSNEEYLLLFVPTGQTYYWNFKHRIYFCPKNWHSRNFKYFGLYNWKSVRSISEIETIIQADYNAKNKRLNVLTNNHSKEQIARLKLALEELGENHSGLKYYILPLNSFYETDFQKTSHGGIQGFRYKDLREFLPNENFSDLSVVANKLRSVTWK